MFLVIGDSFVFQIVGWSISRLQVVWEGNQLEKYIFEEKGPKWTKLEVGGWSSQWCTKKPQNRVSGQWPWSGKLWPMRWCLEDSLLKKITLSITIRKLFPTAWWQVFLVYKGRDRRLRKHNYWREYFWRNPRRPDFDHEDERRRVISLKWTQAFDLHDVDEDSLLDLSIINDGFNCVF